jgi:hypothetical protein
VELGGYHFVTTGNKEEGVRAEEVGGVSSVNKMLRSLSNAGRGFCVGRARVSPEAWVADFAMSGWVEMAQIRGYLPPGTVWGNLSFLYF